MNLHALLRVTYLSARNSTRCHCCCAVPQCGWYSGASIYVCASVFASIYVCASVFASIYLCASVSASIYLCASVSASIYLCASIYTRAAIYSSESACITPCHATCLPVLPVCLVVQVYLFYFKMYNIQTDVILNFYMTCRRASFQVVIFLFFSLVPTKTGSCFAARRLSHGITHSWN